MIEIYTDGLCMPVNPGGVATYGFEVRRNRLRIYEDQGVVGEGQGMSNNVAEYRAVEKAARWLAANGLDSEPVVFKSDSKLVVNQMKGAWSAKKGFYLDYYNKARKAVSTLRAWRFEWIPRDQNSHADALTERAYIEYRRRRP